MSSHSDKGEKTEIGKNACIDLDRANIVTLYFLVKCERREERSFR